MRVQFFIFMVAIIEATYYSLIIHNNETGEKFQHVEIGNKIYFGNVGKTSKPFVVETCGKRLCIPVKKSAAKKRYIYMSKSGVIQVAENLDEAKSQEISFDLSSSSLFGASSQLVERAAKASNKLSASIKAFDKISISPSSKMVNINGVSSFRAVPMGVPTSRRFILTGPQFNTSTVHIMARKLAKYKP